MHPFLFGCAILVVSTSILAATRALAIDGVVLINQSKALAGGVTPGDAPGFPITLDQPGSYKLSSNLFAPSGVDGITIAAHDVTIDLNGFTLHGGAVARYGVFASAKHNVSIVKGMIAGFLRHAVLASSGQYWIIENARIVKNGLGLGINHNARVVKNTISDNGGAGVVCSGCMVESNLVAQNNGYGVLADGGMVLGNTIRGNVKQGIAALGTSFVGFGNNAVFSNNGGNAQVSGVNLKPLHPNACAPAC